MLGIEATESVLSWAQWSTSLLTHRRHGPAEVFSSKSQEGAKLLSQLQDRQAADIPLYSENGQTFGAIQASTNHIKGEIYFT